MNSDIIKKLDLEGFCADFLGFFARGFTRQNGGDSPLDSPKVRDSHAKSQDLLESLKISGDLKEAKQKIDELSNIIFTPPPPINNLNNELLALKKHGILRLESIYEFAKIIKYFLYLKNLNLDNLTQIPKMLGQIIIPSEILQIANAFENDGNLKSGQEGELYSKFDSLNSAIKSANAELKKQLEKLLSAPKLAPYLIDKSAHFIDGRESLLLSAGFGAVLKGRIMQRTQAGFFYVLPDSLQHIYERIDKLRNEREIVLYEIEKAISATMSENLAFLKFINAEFDRFDALQARVFFAKARNFEFIAPNANKNKNDIILQDFCHPNISNPIPCNIAFERQIMLVTGVNAGGKTMLLKSVLSASFLANLLIPFKINPHHSKIPHFRHIEAIISDPQDSKNDISTFAGRMLEFSKILTQVENKSARSANPCKSFCYFWLSPKVESPLLLNHNPPSKADSQNLNADSANLSPKDEFATLLGIDEIELGTDANEASALYFALLEHLEQKNIKVIITTHHKILASKMADNPCVELLAALYDEKNRAPTYQFLKGTIGKSYAFESAVRYGIPRFIIERAQKIYDENLENLNALLEQTTALKANLSAKEAKIEANLEKIERKKDELNALIEAQNNELGAKKAKLEDIYNKALEQLKAVLKQNDSKEIHRFLNAQHKAFGAIPKESEKKHIDFKVGHRIAQGKNIGVILSIKGEVAQIELENGVRVRTKLSKLKLAPQIAPKAQSISVSKSAKSCSVSLDLHGKRVDEALEMLDLYISDCLMAGFSEVVIKHGIGSGVLSAVVRDFLSAHPKVKSFEDAPPNMGGFGAKIVKF